MGFWNHAEGRYRLYTDQERREYGRGKAEEMSKAWHAKYISRWTLLHERGWTEAAIDEFLGLPVKSGAPTPAYYRYRVERSEAGKRWQAFMERERREKRDWELNFVSKAELKRQGWTEAAMRKFLPEPTRRNQYARYRKEDVKKAEGSDAFAEWLASRIRKS